MRFRLRNKLSPHAYSNFPRRRTGKFKILPLIIFIVFTFYYYQSNQGTVPLTGRTQLRAMTTQQEIALGLSSYNQILNQSQVLTSGPEVDWVRRVGNRVVQVLDVDDYQWEFNVIQSDQANAFCLPGGKVAVYTGILPIAKNDDGLAVILAHEIAHAIARHGSERMAYQQLKDWGQMAVGMSVGEMSPQAQQMVMGAFGLGSQFGLLLPYSRKHESEADYMGLIYMSRACFNPEEAIQVWKRMLEANPARQSEFLSTHPNPETRIDDFKNWMSEAFAEQSKFCLLNS